MKRKELYSFVREEIVNELTLSEGTAEENAAKAAELKSIDAQMKALMTKKSEVSKSGAVAETELEEMARKANTLKVGSQEKFEAAKDLYEGGWIANLLNFIAEAGEEGISQKDLAEKLGKKDSANINPAIQELKMVGAIATTRVKGEEAPEEAPEEDDVIAVAGGEEEAGDEEEKEDTFYKADTEFDAPEEEPKMADIKAAEKIVAKGYAKVLSPEEEEKYTKLRKGIEAKVLRLSKLPKAKRLASDDMKVLRQLITREDVKKLFKDKGISLKDIVADVIA
jgi:biotin operon repressor